MRESEFWKKILLEMVEDGELTVEESENIFNQLMKENS